MHTNAMPCRPATIGTRWARAAAFSLRRAAAWMHRAARAVERNGSAEAERHYARMLLSRYGKLD